MAPGEPGRVGVMTTPTVTLQDVPVADREAMWCKFLRELQQIEPWAYHRLLKRELELHDLYIDGMRLVDIRLMLSFND